MTAIKSLNLKQYRNMYQSAKDETIKMENIVPGMFYHYKKTF